MLEEDLLKCCKALKLSKNIVDNSKAVTSENCQEYLLKLLQMEVEHRNQLKTERLIKKAGFPVLKSFSNYRFDDIKLPSSLAAEDLKNMGFLDEKKNLILYGNVGTGKTHLAIAIGVTSCRKGLKVGFYKTASLVNQLMEAKAVGKLTTLMNYLQKLDLLICDEWGYVPLDREASQLLFQVISDSYERRSVILTTNLEFSRWVGIFYDEQMTAAIIDRLMHHSYLLIYDGQSNRMKESLAER